MTHLRRPHPVLGAIAVALATLAIAPLAAVGHDLPRERTALFEASRSGLEAMVVFQEPPGRRIRLLKSQFDFDGDGRLTGAEADAAASSWVPYALGDLEIRIDGRTPDRTTTRIKFQNEHNGALSSAIYLQWDVSDLEPGARRTLEIARAGDAPSFPTLLRAQVRSGVSLAGAPGPVRDGESGPYRLAPGDSVALEFRRERRSLPLPTRRP